MTRDPFRADRDPPRDYVEDQWSRHDDELPSLWDFSGPTWFGLGMIAGTAATVCLHLLLTVTP